MDFFELERSSNENRLFLGRNDRATTKANHGKPFLGDLAPIFDSVLYVKSTSQMTALNETYGETHFDPLRKFLSKFVSRAKIRLCSSFEKISWYTFKMDQNEIWAIY